MEYAWIFMLFFAVLAAAWFYLQRAKARPTNSVANDETAAASPDERPAS